MIKSLSYHAICDVGCVRKNNEDMAYACGRIVRDISSTGECAVPCAFAVADGMGGYEGGEIASEIVIRSFSVFAKKIADFNDESSRIEAVKKWASDANALVLDTANIRSGLSEMGTTFVGLIFFCDNALLVNVGDSRCYRLRDGVLKQLTVDHSERNRTGDANVPSNLIYNFMGTNQADFISDVDRLSPMAGDLYMLCSDGLSDLVSESDIEMNALSPSRLVEIAKKAGGRDNITLVCIEV